MERIVMHIDVNSAFLSWSALKLLKEGYKKDIRNEVAVISGSENKRKGIVVAASVPAKKLGIKSPTNLFEARKIYKDLIVVRPDREFYNKCSKALMDYLKSLFPIFEQYSIDECFVEYTDMKMIYGDPIKYAYKLKDEIYKKLGFTVNIGIGNNKVCAKMASDFEKPNKVHTLFMNEVKTKMWPLDISDLFMAGKSACIKLRSYGINTIGELANYDENKIIKILKSHGKMLYEYANGIDNSKVENVYDDRKGIGFSRTLEEDETDKVVIYKYLNEFSKDISLSLKKRNLYAGTVVATIRYSSFKTVNHQIKLKNNINSVDEIFKIGKEAFNKLWNNEPIRLIGLRVCNLSSNNDIQLSLFDEDNVIKMKETDKLIDKLNNELGKDIIFKGNKLRK